jgi:hypothetical protein
LLTTFYISETKLENESFVYENGKIMKNLDFNQDLHTREIMELQDLLVQKMGKAAKK